MDILFSKSNTLEIRPDGNTHTLDTFVPGTSLPRVRTNVRVDNGSTLFDDYYSFSQGVKVKSYLGCFILRLEQEFL